MKLEVVKNNNKALPVSKKFLKTFVDFLEENLVKRGDLAPNSKKNLIIAFVSPEDIQSLNKKFLKKDKLTDILSFSPVDENSVGELILCAEKIQTQAKAHDLTVEEETAYLVLHGFLHLLGYQHEKGGSSAVKMYKLQDEIFHEWQSMKK